VRAVGAFAAIEGFSGLSAIIFFYLSINEGLFIILG